MADTRTLFPGLSASSAACRAGESVCVADEPDWFRLHDRDPNGIRRAIVTASGLMSQA